jgi:hypothetical protein
MYINKGLNSSLRKPFSSYETNEHDVLFAQGFPEQVKRRVPYKSKRLKRKTKEFSELTTVFRQIRILFGTRLTRLEVDFINDTANSAFLIYKSRGRVEFNEYLKLLHTLTFQTAVRSKRCLSVRQSRFPRRARAFILRFKSLYSVSRGGLFLKALLSVVTINTMLLGSGEADESVLEPINSQPRSDLNSYLRKKTFRCSLRKATGRYMRSLGLNTVEFKDKLLHLITVTKLEVNSASVNPMKALRYSPQFPVFDPVTKKLGSGPGMHRMTSCEAAEYDALLLYESDTYEYFKTYLLESKQSELFAQFVLCVRKAFVNNYHVDSMDLNRLGFKPDRKLKNRPYAKVNYWIQLALTGMHNACYSVIDQDCTNYAYDHRLAFLSAVDLLDNKRTLYCLDETAATDRLFLGAYRDVLSVIFSPDIANAWFRLIASLEFAVEGIGNVRFTVGQPLGTKSSWPLYNIVSAVLDLYSNPRSKTAPAIRVGDDSVFWGPNAWKMKEIREKCCNVSFGQNKGCISKYGVEVVKCFYAHGFEVTPIPANLLFKSTHRPSSWMMLVDRVDADLSLDVDALRALASYQSYRRGRPCYKLELQRLLFIEAKTSSFVSTWLLEARKLATLRYLSTCMDGLTAVMLLQPDGYQTISFRVRNAGLAKVKEAMINVALEVQTCPEEPDYRMLARLNTFSPVWEDEVTVQEKIYSNLFQYFFYSEDRLRAKQDQYLTHLQSVELYI